jgi:hypothetical protein
LLALPGAAARADDATALLERLQVLEAESASLLLDHYRFEESLMTPDNDRLTVFLYMPHGARMILNDATLVLDGKPVLKHVFSVNELQTLRDRNALLFYVSRLPAGEHTLRLDVRAMQGRLVPMKTHAFVKGETPKFVEIQIAGYDERQPFAMDW